MLKILTTLLIGLVAFIGGSKVQDNSYNAGAKDRMLFGAISYPTSLDSFTNPSATDSVATVSHSAQHANANDAIEALQAKLGIGVSTAVSNSVLAGNGTGSSGWTTTPTLSTLTISGLGTFGSFISQASSTILGGLTITGNSTTTNATTTILAATTATSTNYFGAGLATCQSGNALTWNNGKFGCTAISTSSGIPDISLATSSNTSYLASTTSMVAGNKITWNATCQRSADNSQLSVGYKLSNEAASTTVFQFGSAAGADPTAFGLFVATTSVTITVDMASAACDQGGQLLVTLYK